jgi:alcohol dehydrogenase class IV
VSDFDRDLFITQPRVLAFGAGCVRRLPHDLADRGVRSAFVVASRRTRALAEPVSEDLRGRGISAAFGPPVPAEPTVTDFRQACAAAADAGCDAVIGFGGGSVMDVAKLVAALVGQPRDVCDCFGVGRVSSRSRFLACVPTTAGTGSEVSPNAILLDEAEQLKKGIISPHLVPDAAYVDPELTRDVPPALTAATGIDALTHCIEAFANRFAHPLVDAYALAGVRLIAAHLERATFQGDDLAARSAVALGSLYGGMCLGPVNTGAVHALAYPLGSQFGIAHGLSNALLLPHVLSFNLPAAVDRYAEVAVALGEPRQASAEETARAGVRHLRDLCRKLGIPASLAALGMPETSVPAMAESAMTITRLLERNPRVLRLDDAVQIYRSAF